MTAQRTAEGIFAGTVIRTTIEGKKEIREMNGEYHALFVRGVTSFPEQECGGYDGETG